MWLPEAVVVLLNFILWRKNSVICFVFICFIVLITLAFMKCCIYWPCKWEWCFEPATLLFLCAWERDTALTHPHTHKTQIGWAQITFTISEMHCEAIRQDTTSKSLDIKLKLSKLILTIRDLDITLLVILYISHFLFQFHS
jgi:hypothetical protein